MNDLVPLRVRVPQIMAFVHQNEVTVPVFHVVQKPGDPRCLVFPQKPHRQDARIQLIDFVVPLPHLHQRCRADDQRARVVGPLEVFHDGRADVTLAKPHHIGDERATEIPDHLNRLPYGHLLKTRQLAENIVIPEQLRLVLGLQPVPDQGVERLHVDVVGTNLRRGPGRLKLRHQGFVERLRLLPQIVEPMHQFAVVLVALNDDVQLGVVRQTRQRQIGRSDNGDSLLVPFDLLAQQVENLAVVADVSLGVEAALHEHAHLQTLLLDHAHQPGHQLLSLIRLIHPFNGVAEIPRRLIGHPRRLCPFRIGLPLKFLGRQVKPPVPLGQQLDRLFVGRVADQEPQLLHVQEPLRHACEPREEQIADRKAGTLGCAQNIVQVVDQLLVLIVNDVMRRHG